MNRQELIAKIHELAYECMSVSPESSLVLFALSGSLSGEMEKEMADLVGTWVEEIALPEIERIGAIERN